MDFKIGGPSGAKATDKKKPAARTGAAGGTSFASMLEQAGAADAPASAAPSLGILPTVVPGFDEPIQPDARERGKQLLEQLEALTQDVLAGQPSAALHKLKETLAHQPANSPLTTEQQQALDDLATRAAVEVAKLEESQ